MLLNLIRQTIIMLAGKPVATQKLSMLDALKADMIDTGL